MRTNQKGFTLIELLIVVAIIGIIAAIAIPGLLRARMSGNEASAIGSLRAINTAQQNFSQLCNGYGNALAVLGTTGPGGTNPYLSPDMTTDPVVKSGYTTALVDNGAAVTVGPCVGQATNAYYVSALPITLNSTGTRAFATDQAGTIYQDTTGAAAPAQPFATAVNGTTITAIQ